MDVLTYKIDTFEGPLDLLLTLISKNKMDIADIQIAVIFEQYMAYLDRMKHMDMEIAGEFIVMASELMLIKSRMLLPKPENPGEEDPRARLAAALLAYRQAKEAAAYLEKQYACFSARYTKDEDEVPCDKTDLDEQDVMLLQKALLRLFSKKDTEAPQPISNIAPIIKKTIVPISEKIRTVTEQLRRDGCMPFTALFAEAESKSEIVAIFMAVLALVKDGHILLDKRLSAGKPDEADALYDEVTDYTYEFYCSLNPENAVTEDEIGMYDDIYPGDAETNDTSETAQDIQNEKETES